MSEVLNQLSRRERQIMEVVLARGRASVAEILESISEPPSNSSIRTLLRVMEDKGYLTHQEIGRVFVYLPTVKPETARRSALGHLVDTLFDGSTESVVSALLKLRHNRLDPAEADRISRMIDDAVKGGR